MVMSELLNDFNCIVDKNYQSLETIKRQYGIVKELVANTDSAKVVVKIRNVEDDNDDKTKMITLLNKTGQRLKVDDRIWVYYWRTITDGYVAIKVGKQRKKKDKLRLSIARAMVVTDDEDTLETITENELRYFQVANLIHTQSGAMPNVPFVNGYPAAYCPIVDFATLPDRINNNTVGYTDYINYILGLSSVFFVKRIVLPYSWAIEGYSESTDAFVLREFKIDIYKVRQYENKWYYQPALYWRKDISVAHDGSSWSDWEIYDIPSENIFVKSPNDLISGEFAIIYNHINFAETNSNLPQPGYNKRPWNPYGVLRGALVFRLLSKGVDPVNHLDGIDIYFTRKNPTYSNSDPIFGLTSRVEKDYIRQLQSKTESYPY